MVRIGVIGAGHLVEFHIRSIQNIARFELIGFINEDEAQANHIVLTYGVKRFSSMEELLVQVDAIDLIPSTSVNFDTLTRVVKASRHVFIAQSINPNLEEARQLVDLVYEANVKVQLNYFERFNPAFIQAEQFDIRPLYIETQRLIKSSDNSSESLIFDIMIHDIDITLKLVRSNVKSIYAAGVNVFGNTPDIANARIEFDNGCVANLTASRISMENRCETRIFQKDTYLRMDFLKNKSTLFQSHNQAASVNTLTDVDELTQAETNYQAPESRELTFLQNELEQFSESISSNLPVAVSVQDGYDAMNIAWQITEKIQSKANIR